MQKANGRQKQNSYRFKPRQRDVPAKERGTTTRGVVRNNEGGNAANAPPQQRQQEHQQRPQPQEVRPEVLVLECPVLRLEPQAPRPVEQSSSSQTPSCPQRENDNHHSPGPFSRCQEKDEEPEQNDGKKKKKKDKIPKEVKQQRREEAALLEIYKPKDSHISVLNPDLFQKLKEGAARNWKASFSGAGGAFRFTPTTPKQAPSSRSVTEFPSLDACQATNRAGPSVKSFADAVSSSPAPIIVQPTPENAKASEIPSLQTPPKPRLSKRPITCNLEDLLVPSKPKQRQQKDSPSLLLKKISRRTKKDKLSAIRENPKLTTGNFLDSCGPVVIHRGKIKQKKKKLSHFKKLILKARESRKTVLVNPEAINVNQVIENGNCDSNQVIVEEVTIVSKDIDCPEEEEQLLVSRFKQLLEEAEDSSVTVPQTVMEMAKVEMHSRKFRSYCDMFVTKELHGLVIPMMSELHRLQDRIYKTDPIKLPAKRRYVNGIKEVTTAVQLRKAQLVILAPDIEPASGDGGLDAKISEIICRAKENKIPYIFSGSRFILGKCIKQFKSPVSVIAVLDKQNVEELFTLILQTADILRSRYEEELNRRVGTIMKSRR